MPIDSLEELSRLALIAKFASFPIPSRLDRIFQALRFSDFEKALAKGVLQIECTARPPEVRLLEFMLGIISCISSLVTASPPRNYTVGPFQIGIGTSLRWTRTPLTPWQYLRRLVFLATTEGSARMFRLAIRRSGATLTTADGLRDFGEFYNGKGNWFPRTLKYDELLLMLTEQHRPRDNQSGFNETIRLEIDRRFTARLNRIRDLVISGQYLEGVLLLCSVSAKKILHAECYGNIAGDFPVIDTPRPVGSTFKVALYSAFLEKRKVDKNFEVDDHPIRINWRGEDLRPRNADRKFRGLVTLEYAFANSINIPALEIARDLGIENFVYFLRKCGIHRPLPNTPLLALGAVPLTGIELLATMTPILTGGFLSWPLPSNQNRNVITPLNDGERLLSSQTCNTMRELLKATITNGTASFLKSLSNPGLGGKTGTSEGSRDFWFMGAADEDRYGLVWLGFRDGRKIVSLDGKDASASRFAVPLWAEVAEVLLQQPLNPPMSQPT